MYSSTKTMDLRIIFIWLETNVQVKWMLLRVVYHKHKSHTFTYFCHSNWLFACSYLKNLDAFFLLNGYIAEVICVTLYKLVFFQICRNNTSYTMYTTHSDISNILVTFYQDCSWKDSIKPSLQFPFFAILNQSSQHDHVRHYVEKYVRNTSLLYLIYTFKHGFWTVLVA